jgi:hypothetical protein
VDLRASSSPTSVPAGTIVIPAARRPFRALHESVDSGGFSLSRQLGEKPLWASAAGLRQLIAIVEAVLLVVGIYALIGAGIGAAAGSVMVGMGIGLIAGVGAVAAILLVRGSAVTADTPAGPACEMTAEPVTRVE